MVEEAQANARGDAAGGIKAAAKRDGQELASLSLIGDDEAALAHRELLLHLWDRYGRGLAAEDVVRSIETLSRVSQALSEQEDLARAGKTLKEMSPATIAQLSDAGAVSDRILGFDMPPTLNGRITRIWMDLMRWSKRHRREAATDRANDKH